MPYVIYFHETSWNSQLTFDIFAVTVRKYIKKYIVSVALAMK